VCACDVVECVSQVHTLYITNVTVHPSINGKHIPKFCLVTFGLIKGQCLIRSHNIQSYSRHCINNQRKQQQVKSFLPGLNSTKILQSDLRKQNIALIIIVISTLLPLPLPLLLPYTSTITLRCKYTTTRVVMVRL